MALITQVERSGPSTETVASQDNDLLPFSGAIDTIHLSMQSKVVVVVAQASRSNLRDGEGSCNRQQCNDNTDHSHNGMGDEGLYLQEGYSQVYNDKPRTKSLLIIPVGYVVLRQSKECDFSS
jgi:hypothetical protein